MTDVDTGVPAAVGGEPGLSVPRAEGSGLTSRLVAVSRLIQIGSARGGAGGFDAGLLADAEELLARAGERLRLSADHTIVVLAGGTGSGKSSLFNAMAGADFSPVGAVRPVTRAPYACVWGMRGAGPLLDWLGVAPHDRYARSSALDEGERSLAGLLLLDIPDHDSVLAGHSREVSRLVSHADLIVWVLDPQKYADAAVHSRYLIPMASHSSVMAVVLNQSDRLTAEQAADCETDLRRLLDSEGLQDAHVVVTSAVTGAGIGDLRKVLVEALLARRSAVERISADVDAIAARFAPYAEDTAAAQAGAAGERTASSETGRGAAGSAASDSTASDSTATDSTARSGGAGAAEAEVEAGSELARVTAMLTDAFSQAAGVSGIGRALQSARELKAADYVGWPVSWLIDRLLRRDPVRKVRLGTLWDELRQMSAGSAGAQQPEIDNAITAVAQEAGRGMPSPWPAAVRRAARSAAADIPAAIGAAIAEVLPTENVAEFWWRAMAAWQGLLLGGVVAGLAWVGALLAFGVFHASRHVTLLFRDSTLLPWVLLIIVALLVIGSLSANGCMALVARSAERERERAEQRMRDGITTVAREKVIAPVEQELSEYARFQTELAAARQPG